MDVHIIEDLDAGRNVPEAFVEYRALSINSEVVHVKLPIAGWLVKDRFLIRDIPGGHKETAVILTFSTTDSHSLASESKAARLYDEIFNPPMIQDIGSGDSKPEGKENNNPKVIELKVFGENCEEIYFKVKMKTKLGKLKQAYCQEIGIRLTSMMFLFGNRRINDTDTPKKLEMVDGDEILVTPELFD